MTTVKQLRKWLKSYDDSTEIDIVKVIDFEGEIQVLCEPLDISLVSGNIHIGLEGETKFIRLGAIIQVEEKETSKDEVKSNIVVPNSTTIIH